MEGQERELIITIERAVSIRASDIDLRVICWSVMMTARDGGVKVGSRSYFDPTITITTPHPL
jgi:hypothetical protein